MNVLNRISRNIFFKTLGEIGSRVLYFVYIFYCARRLGDAEFGKYSLVYSFAGMFLILIELGLNTLLVRDIGADHARLPKYFANLLTLKGLLSIFALGLMFLIAGWLYQDAEKLHLIRLMGIFTVTSALLEFGYAVFSSLEQMQYEAILKTLHRFLISIFGILALWLGYGLEGAIYGIISGGILSLLIGGWLISRKVTRIRLEWDSRFNWRLLREAFPLSLMAIFIVLYFRLNVVMLSKLGASDAEIGWFSGAVRLMDIIGIIPALAITAMLPVFASISQNSQAVLKKLYEKSFKSLFVVGLLVTLSVSLFARLIMQWSFGAEFLPGAAALRWLVWASLLMFVNQLILNLLIVLHHQHLNAISTGICVVVNLTLNWLLIPYFSFLGASVATVATELTLFILNYQFISKYFYRLNLWRLCYKSILAGLLMAGCYLLFQPFNPFFALGAGILIFLGTLVVLQDFSRADLQALQNLVRGGLPK
ncbi:flippase [candidate division KSB1 bacterium]|nr:flippase [candidate division KSB1 bacterium]